MKLYDLLDLDALHRHIDEGEIASRHHKTEPLVIYNYTARAQYSSAWTHETKTCRGIIVDEEQNILARPFPKFFNYEEHSHNSLKGPLPMDEEIEVFEKLDGSLGILYIRPSDHSVAVATRGAFHSPQAEWANEWLNANLSRQELMELKVHICHDKTLLFEILCPESKVVVDYGGHHEMVFLTAIDLNTGKTDPSISWNRAKAKLFPFKSITETFTSAKELKGSAAEGYVVLFKDSDVRTKVKGEDYVRLHRLLCGFSKRSIWELLSSGQGIQEALNLVPDEFYGWVKKVEKDLLDKYAHIQVITSKHVNKAQSVLGVSRKEQAAYFQSVTEDGFAIDVAFLMLTQKKYSKLIWKRLYPDHELFHIVDEATG